MERVLCNWCGKTFNEENAYYPTLLGKLSLGVLGMTPLCSKKCLTNYKKNKNSDKKENFESKKNDIQEKSMEIELKYLKKTKELEFDKLKQNQKNEFQNQQNGIRHEKRMGNLLEAKEYLDNGGNKTVYYLKYLWAILDTTWKKILFVFMVWIFVTKIIELFTK